MKQKYSALPRKILTVNLVVLLVCLALVALSSSEASADARINIDGNNCHFPKEKIDTDNEIEASCSASIDKDPETGAFEGHATSVVPMLKAWLPPEEKIYGYDECVLRNSAGGETTAPKWFVRVDHENCSRYYCDVVRYLVCYGN